MICHTISKLEACIRNHRWQPDWRLWTLVLVFLPLLIWLGIWQLGRAEEKAAQQARWETLSPVEWPISGQAIEGQPVIIEGRFVPDKQWLLDNRTRGGRAGYEVLTLFEPRHQPPVVINRGWLPGPRDRATLPAIPVSGNEVYRLKARVADWPAPPVIGAVEEPKGWPRRVQALTPELASQNTDQTVDGTFLRLADEQQPGALQVDWAPARLGVDTHYGYAVQWFGLAIALTVLSIVASFRKPRSIDSSHD